MTHLGLLLSLLLGLPVLAYGVVVLQGAGSTLAYTLYSDAALAYNFLTPNISVSYTGVGSGKGICRIENNCPLSDTQPPLAVDFAGSDAVLKPSDYASYPDLQMYPTVASAVVPIYNVPGVVNLTLSTAVLARIFLGNVTTWDDPAIRESNPGFESWHVPAGQPIELVVRSDSSGTTEIFKKALADFNPTFRVQVGADSSAFWGETRTTGRSGTQGLIAYVMMQPYTLGYSVLGDAQTNDMAIATLRKPSGAVVAASTTSITFAVLQLGMDFGNNGDNASHLTVDLQNADGPYAWPIVGFTYLVLRKSTVRPGADCASVRGTAAFWQWFYTADVVEQMMERLQFSALPPVLRDQVTARLASDVKCDGQPAWTPPIQQPIRGVGPGGAEALFVRLGYMYQGLEQEYPVTFAPTSTNSSLEDNMFLLTVSPPQVHAQEATLLLAGMGIVAITPLTVVLDVPTLALILDGAVTTWLHPAILALNPNGVVGADGHLLTDPTQSIVLLQGPLAASPEVAALLTAYAPDYTGQAWLEAEAFPTEDILRSAVVGNPYTLAITPLSGDYPDGLQLVAVRRKDGHVVAPTWAAVQACATEDVYDAAHNAFRLAQSLAVDCYPLALPLFFTLRRSACDEAIDGPRTATVAFAEWLASAPTLSPVFWASRLAPLLTISPRVIAANEAALAIVTCTKRPTSYALPAGVAGGVGGALLLLAVLGVGLRRRGGRDNRAAPKDPAQPFTVLFTDIEASTKLWARMPGDMAGVLDDHHRLIRRLIKKHQLYEVKTIGDSFMCTCLEPWRALQFALDLQEELHAHDWGPATAAINQLYRDSVGSGLWEIDGKKGAAPGAGDEEWNGLRVRVGIHHGVGNIRFDPVSGGFDYYGTVVNTAARVESVCHGGQVGVTVDVLQSLDGEPPNSVWTNLGTHPLRGLSEPLQLFQVLPSGPLARRKFPRLRLELLNEAWGEDDPLQERRPSATTLTSAFSAFRAEAHSLVLKGDISAPELQRVYGIATSTLQTVLATQTAKDRDATLSILCTRLKVPYKGSVGALLQHALHGLVMRILPALVAAGGRRASRTSVSSDSVQMVSPKPSSKGSPRNRRRPSNSGYSDLVIQLRDVDDDIV